ncbi:U1-hexatoxin-Iw1c-like [Littorina saxatilis]|uniref:Prokineticin domain-containing protein n=1 Tax=Littorina saxatilis TaxID=31220 RepID=A0AAN9GGD8_9CAEN
MMRHVLLLALVLLPALVCGKQCGSDADCGSGECCITFGRKRFEMTFGSGHCTAMAQLGEACEPYRNLFGNGHSFNCPCASGLECHGETEKHEGGSDSYQNSRCTNPQ